jgi:hypothetical protein
MSDADTQAREMIRDAERYRALRQMIISINKVPKSETPLYEFAVSDTIYPPAQDFLRADDMAQLDEIVDAALAR